MHPSFNIDGSFSGVGAESETSFSGVGFIQGYESQGVCEGEPAAIHSHYILTEHLVNENCEGDYSTRAFTYCNVAGSTIPSPMFMDFFLLDPVFITNMLHHHHQPNIPFQQDFLQMLELPHSMLSPRESQIVTGLFP
jgi:hypothetical protein